ncbi:MAG: site-specific integrase, partial [Patescibacteria group bacterium]
MNLVQIQSTSFQPMHNSTAPNGLPTSVFFLFSTYLRDRNVPTPDQKQLELLFDRLLARTSLDSLEKNPANALLSSLSKSHVGQPLPAKHFERLQAFCTYVPQSQAETFLQHFLLALKDDNCSQSTIKNYRSDIKQFLLFADFGSIDSCITKPKVDDFLKKQVAKGLTQQSVKRKLASLNQFGHWLERTGVARARAYAWLDDLNHNYPNPSPRSEATSAARAFWLNMTSLFKPKLKPQISSKIDQSNAFSIPFVPTPSTTEPVSLDKNSSESSKRPTARRFQELRHQLKESQRLAYAVLSGNRSNPAAVYIQGFLFFILFLGMGYFGYQQLFVEPPQPLAYPSTLTRPNRSLSFQGRLTDTARNPITSATDMRFRLYDTGPGTGGTLLWDSGTCSVTPDQDGIFASGLGDDCGSEISDDVFSENANVWLEVEIETETLTPRQAIKSVAYALNSETLQGFPPADPATENTVLVMNNSGQVQLGTTNPELIATGDSFTITADSLTLETTSGTDGDIVLSPDGLGEIIAESYIAAPGATLSATYAGGTALTLRAGPSATANIMSWTDSSNTTLGVIDESGNVGIGTNDPSRLLHVAGDMRLTAALYDGNNEAGTNGQLLSSTGTGTDWIDAGALGTDDQTLAEVLGEGNTSGGNDVVLSTTDEIRFYDDDADQRIYASSDGVLEIDSTTTRISQLTTNGVVYTSGSNGTLNSEAQLATSRGGLGANVTAAGAGELLYSTATTTYDSLAAGTSGQALVSGGAGAPSWGTLGLTYGGSNADLSSAAQGGVIYKGASALAGTAAGTSGQLLQSNGSSAPSWVDVFGLGSRWANTDNVYHPANEFADVVDLTLGGTSTASANVHLRSDGRGFFGNDLHVQAGGALDTNAAGSLTIGGSTQNALTLGRSGATTTINGSSIVLGTQGTSSTHALQAGRLVNTDNGLTGGGALTSDLTLELTGQALALHNFSSTGIMVRTGASSFAARSIAGTSDRISISNGDGTSGNPTIDIASSYVGQASITTLGTIGTGTWQASVINEAYGGTAQSSYTTGDMLYASGTNTLAKLSVGSNGQILGVSSGVPSWQDAFGLGSRWANTDNVYHPGNEFADVVDLTLGGTSTASANIHLRSDGRGFFGNDLHVQAGGSLDTNAAGTLTIGGSNQTGLTLGRSGQSTNIANLTTDGVVYTSGSDGTLNTEAQLATSRGGLGANVTAAGAGELLYSTATTTYDSLAAGTSGQALVSGGAGAPSWGTLGLTYGGTADDLSGTAAGGVIFKGISALGATAAGTSGQLLQSNGSSAPSWADAFGLGSRWANTDNVYHPGNEFADVVDLTLGGTSTASANIHLRSDGQGYFAGNVGIGTSNPARKLEIADSGAFPLSLYRSTNTALSGVALEFTLQDSNNARQVYGDIYAGITTNTAGSEDGFLGFRTASVGNVAERMRINPTGNVGIGTTDPADFKLQVRGSIGPQTNDTYDLGSDSLRWAEAHATNFYQ